MCGHQLWICFHGELNLKTEQKKMVTNFGKIYSKLNGEGLKAQNLKDSLYYGDQK